VQVVHGTPAEEKMKKNSGLTVPQKKQPVSDGLWPESAIAQQLLDFGFLENHMLANHGIKFFDLHFFGHGALVLGGGVEITSSSAGHQTNLVTHDFGSLDLLTLGAQVSNDLVDTQLVDDAHALGGQTQTDETLFAFHPETVVVQVRLEPALGFVVGVRDVVANDWTLAGNLANLGHDRLHLTCPWTSQRPDRHTKKQVE
jgi:hypothetical protein